MEPQTPTPAPSNPPQSPAPEPAPTPPVNPTPTPPLTPATNQTLPPTNSAPTFSSVPGAAFPPSAPSPVSPTPLATPPTNGKYKVFEAIKEVFNSIKRNPVATLVPLVLGYAASIVLAILTTAIGVGIMALAFTSGLGANLWLLVLFVLVAVVAQVVVQTAFSSAFILALKESSEGTHHSLGAYLQRGFRVFGKVFVATLMVLGYALVPLLLAIIFFTLGSFVESLKTITNILGFVTALASIAWILIIAIRYSLYWQVALFEPDTTARQALARSRELIKGRGEWFIVRTAALLIVVSMIISAITGGGKVSTSDPAQDNWIANILTIVLIPFIYGIPTMLYLHLSGNKKQPESVQSHPQAPTQTL